MPQNVACRLSRISNRPHVAYLVLVTAYLTWVAMWDRYFQQRASIGITRSCKHWYMRKNYLILVKTKEITIWCGRKDFLSQGKISDIPIQCKKFVGPNDSSAQFIKK